MTTNRFIRFAMIAASFGLTFAGATQAAAKTVILFNNFAPFTNDSYTKIIKPWAEDVARVTDGRVEIKVPPQSLAPPPEQMNMVKAGVADGAFMLNAFLQKSHPLLQIGFLPGTMHSAVADAVAYWRTYQKFFAPRHPINEVKLIGFFAFPPGYIYNIKKTPIQSIAEMKDKKMWSLPGTAARAIGMTGAAVVPGPAARMYDIVSKGVVDGLCCIDYEDMSVFKVMKYIGAVTKVDGGVFSPKFSMFVSNAKWKQISPKDQKAIMAISGEALARRSAAIDAHNEQFRQEYLKRGGIIVNAKPSFDAALKKLWKPLTDQWIARANKLGVDGRAALAYYLNQAKLVESEH